MRRGRLLYLVAAAAALGAFLALRRAPNDAPALRLCPPPGPSQWTVVSGLLLGDASNATLHALEAELIPGRGDLQEPDVLSVLAVIEEGPDSLRVPGWIPLAFRKARFDLTDSLECVFSPGNARSRVRAVYFETAGVLVGLLLQCAVPRGFFGADGGVVQLRHPPSGGSARLSLCPSACHPPSRPRTRG